MADNTRLGRELAKLEVDDPELARLGREINDFGHWLATGEERGEFARTRSRERRLAVMHARRRLWPTRNPSSTEGDGTDG